MLDGYCCGVLEKHESTKCHSCRSSTETLKPKGARTPSTQPVVQCYDGLTMNCSTAGELMLSEEQWSPHRQDVPPAHSACMQRKRKKKKRGDTYTRDRDDLDLVTLQHKR